MNTIFFDAFYSSAEKREGNGTKGKGSNGKGAERNAKKRKERMSLLPHVEPEMDIKIYI